MKEEIKKEWVKRLRSGKYSQATGWLKTIDANDKEAYCCLGVLCEIAVENDIIPPPRIAPADDITEIKHCNFVRSGTGLPVAVQKWIGMDKFGEYRDEEDGEKYTTSLAEDNDSGDDFNMIADIIEKKF